MLRASGRDKDGAPVIIAGLVDENINRLKNDQPISAPLSSFVPGMPGQLVIVWGRDHATLERQFSGAIGEQTKTSFDAQMEQQETAIARHDRILICTVGLPRSGKSTWARSQAWPIVNPDSIRLALHPGQPFIIETEPYVWAIAKTMVRSLFLAGHKIVILDATNTTTARRKEWISSEWSTFWKTFDVGAETCIARAKGNANLISIIKKMDSEREPINANEKFWP